MEVAHAQVANDRKQNINLGYLHHVHNIFFSISRIKASSIWWIRWRCIGKNSNISGFLYSGELFAFIGVGITKSQLLLTISGGGQNSDAANIREGDNADVLLELNGLPLDSFSTHISFLDSQNLDLIYGNLTVLENLMFSAELRLQDPSDPSELAALRLLAEMVTLTYHFKISYWHDVSIFI